MWVGCLVDWTTSLQVRDELLSEAHAAACATDGVWQWQAAQAAKDEAVAAASAAAPASRG
jgi:hypothetical protein